MNVAADRQPPFSLELSYTTKRGAHGIRHFYPRTSSADEVEQALLTRFRAHEETRLVLRGPGGSSLVGGVERIDRWTWWCDRDEIDRVWDRRPA